MTAAAVILPSLAPRLIISAWDVPSGRLHMATYFEGGALPVMLESCWFASWAGPPFNELVGTELTTVPAFPIPCFGKVSSLTCIAVEVDKLVNSQKPFLKIQVEQT